MKRAGLYVRVSTQEQKLHGMSVDAQISTLTAFCEENGYEPYKIYNDAGISARKSYKKRPALLDMIKDCQENRLDIILFTRLDRFFRSVPDYYACVGQMNDIPWKAVLEDYETTTPDGVFKVNIMLSVAQSEADKTSARLKDAFAYKRARGDYLGKPPTGYKIDKNQQLIKDPSTSKAVQAMLNTYLDSFSSHKAIRVARDHGLPLERQSFMKMLSNTAYYGMAAGGHPCEPYITKEQWDRIQDVKRSRTTKKVHGNRTYLFSGIMFCGYCGQRMPAKLTVRTHADGEKVYWKKYVCEGSYGSVRTCPHLQIMEHKLEDYLLSHLAVMLDNLRYEASFRKKGYVDGINRKNRLNAKLERLREVYLDGDISREEYKERKRDIENEIGSIVIQSDEIPELPDDWKEIYNQLTEENKQVFWKKVIRSITVTNETKDNPAVIFR